MRKARFTERQVIGILKEHEAGRPTAEPCRKHGISDQTPYNRKARYGGLKPSEASRLKGLEEENRRLKKLLAEAVMDDSVPRDPLGKNGSGPRRGSRRWRAWCAGAATASGRPAG